MESKKLPSILYSDATLKHDRALINSIVSRWGSNKNTQAKLADKIFTAIQTKQWQRKYPSPHFVFLMDLYMGETITDIRFVGMCQLAEILYFYRVHRSKKGSAARNLTRRFDNKISALFNDVYGKNFNKNTANVLRILRNNVAHTGILKELKGVMRLADQNALNGYKRKHGKNSLRTLAFSFSYLMEETFLLSMGLTIEDLSTNLNPPWNFEIFKGK